MTEISKVPKFFKQHLKHNFRSGLEESNALQMVADGISFDYESLKIKFLQPAKWRTYTPDFILPNGIIIEIKGRLDSGDRQKHIWVAEQMPELDIRFVFGNCMNTISKRSKTTYAKWCHKYGFQFANRYVPKEWAEEDNRPYLKQIKDGIYEPKREDLIVPKRKR